MARRNAKQKQRAWTPMRRGQLNPSYLAAVYPDGIPADVRVEVWSNDLYEATVEHREDGWAYITLKRHDRHAVRDWRHLQSIKNETVGPEREAFELFPAESRLVDGANQYHLWVVPADVPMTVGFTNRAVGDAESVRILNDASGGKGRQRDWQEGLSTGPVPGELDEMKDKVRDEIAAGGGDDA